MARVVLKNVRLSFPVLWEPKEFKAGDGKPRYSATFLVEPGSANDKAIRAAVKTEADAKYGKKADVFLKSIENNSNKFCYLNGDLKEHDGYEGLFYLATHRQATSGAPAIVDRDKTPLDQNSGKPYGGCYVNASIDIYAQAGENPGIRAGLVAIQFYADGDAFTGSPATADDFDDLAGADDFSEFGAP